jgi:hypothetical protein
MSFLDIRIEELLTETEAHLLRSTQPYGWQGLYRSMRRGRLKKIVRIIDAVCLLLLILAVWSGVEFFAATEVMPALKYGFITTGRFIVSAQLKLSLMPHIHAERLIRQMKRIEILLLAKNHKRDDPGSN